MQLLIADCWLLASTVSWAPSDMWLTEKRGKVIVCSHQAGWWGGIRLNLKAPYEPTILCHLHLTYNCHYCQKEDKQEGLSPRCHFCQKWGHVNLNCPYLHLGCKPGVQSRGEACQVPTWHKNFGEYCPHAWLTKNQVI